MFDNVANYGMHQGSALADVLFAKSDSSLDILVGNTTKRTLPPTLNGKTYSVSDGIIIVPDNERDPETGFGVGVHNITKYLPHAYGTMVKTTKFPSVSWMQEGDKVIFRLSIPKPDENELAVYTDFVIRRERAKGDFARAQPYFHQIEDPHHFGKYIEQPLKPATEAIPVLRQAMQSYLEFPEGKASHIATLYPILQTMGKYGTQALHVSEDIVGILMDGHSWVAAVDALVEIEGEKGHFAGRLARSLKEYKGEDEMPLRGIANYFKKTYDNSNPSKTKLLHEGLLDYLEVGNAKYHAEMAEHLVTLDPALIPTQSLDKMLDRIIADNKFTQDNMQTVRAASDTVKAQKTLADSTRSRLEKVYDFATQGVQGASHYHWEIGRLIGKDRF